MKWIKIEDKKPKQGTHCLCKVPEAISDNMKIRILLFGKYGIDEVFKDRQTPDDEDIKVDCPCYTDIIDGYYPGVTEWINLKDVK